MGFKEKPCQICGIIFQPRSGAAKVCDTCRPEWTKRHDHEKYLRNYKQKRETKWAQPRGVDSPFYKNGFGIFQRIAFDNYPHKCSLCGSTEFLCVHHKDRDRKNNTVDNLQILCKSCHQKVHDSGRFLRTEDAKERSRAGASAYHINNPMPRDKQGRFSKLRHSPTLQEIGDNMN